MQDLNFVIRFEIFVHFDGQLRATHLILDHTPAYTSFQDPSHELTVGSPLLSYLDVRLRGFLPKGLTLGEARRLGPWQIREGSLLPVRDGSTDRVFHGRAEHILIKEPHEEIQAKGQVEVESVDFSLEETRPEDSDTEMVVRRTMTVD